MIKENTLLIVGAGASVPYGFPTAIELRREIITKFNSELMPIVRTSFHQLADTKQIDDFLISFDKSNINSIELFLEAKPEYKDLGKISIAYLIMRHEYLLKERSGNLVSNLSLINTNEDWINYLFNRMFDGIKIEYGIDEFFENNIKIINFNYDRLIEWYVLNSLLHIYNNNYEFSEIAKVFQSKFEIHHMNGSVATLIPENFNEAKGLSFGFKCDLEKLKRLAQNIKTIHERENIDNEKINRWFEWASKIFFLGFGFTSENMEALNIRKNIRSSHSIYINNYDYLEGELNRIKTTLPTCDNEKKGLKKF